MSCDVVVQVFFVRRKALTTSTNSSQQHQSATGSRRLHGGIELRFCCRPQRLYLRGFYGSTPPKSWIKFLHGKRNYAMRHCMARSFRNARKSHWAPIKCKKTLGRRGSAQTRWGLQCPPTSPDSLVGGCPHP